MSNKLSSLKKKDLIKIIKAQEAEISNLSQIVLDFKRKIFGKKSEKEKERKSAESLSSFFNKKSKSKSNNKNQIQKRSKTFPDSLPRVEVLHDLGEEEKQCDCGSCLTYLGNETSERIDYIPAKFQVIKDIRLKYSCNKCGKTIKTAKAPIKTFPKCRATSGFISHAIVSKYLDHLPYHRQSEQYRRLGFYLSSDLMSRHEIKSSELAGERIAKLMEQSLLRESYICSDETTLRVLSEGKKAYLWSHISGDRENRIIIYKYSNNRNARNATELLKDFKGYHQTDGYAGYSPLHNMEDIIYVGCMAHVRRKFFECYLASNKKSLAYKIIKEIRKLYRLEDKIKDLSPDQKKKIREIKAKPIFDKLKPKLEEYQKEHKDEKGNKSKLAIAVNYCLNRYDALQVYLSNGRLRIDNNDDEQQMKAIAVGRHNWLFFKSEKGAKSGANFYSIVRTAKEHGIDPERYLKYILDNIHNLTDEKLRKLLPHNINPALLE